MRTETHDELRTALHGMWASVAEGWAEHATFVDARAADVTERMLELADLRPSDRVLELAAGPGGLGLAAAARVAPDGEVVVSDVAAGMTAIAAARATALGLENVTTAVLDLEDVEQPDDSYDVVLCREGLMFATDPARAVAEIRRVLRPQGRVVVTTWGPRAQNPWLAVVFDAVSAQVGAPVPPPGVPHPFALDDADRLGALLAGAGLDGVTVTEVPVPLRVSSFDEWWSRTTALAGPLAARLAALDDEARDALLARAREAARPYETASGLAFPGMTLLASAHAAR
jgi:ubiquinone/menaquinone biosynthesis C-methylase UbiE